MTGVIGLMVAITNLAQKARSAAKELRDRTNPEALVDKNIQFFEDVKNTERRLLAEGVRGNVLMLVVATILRLCVMYYTALTRKMQEGIDPGNEHFTLDGNRKLGPRYPHKSLKRASLHILGWPQPPVRFHTRREFRGAMNISRAKLERHINKLYKLLRRALNQFNANNAANMLRLKARTRVVRDSLDNAAVDQPGHYEKEVVDLSITLEDMLVDFRSQLESYFPEFDSLDEEQQRAALLTLGNMLIPVDQLRQDFDSLRLLAEADDEEEEVTIEQMETELELPEDDETDFFDVDQVPIQF